MESIEHLLTAMRNEDFRNARITNADARPALLAELARLDRLAEQPPKETTLDAIIAEMAHVESLLAMG